MRLASTLLVPLALLAVAGCGVQGKWTLESVEPETARDIVTFAKFTLNKDGTFTAEATEGGETVAASGTYEFADNKLTFTMEDGRKRTYDTDLKCPGNTLHIKSATKDGEEVTAIMRRE